MKLISNILDGKFPLDQRTKVELKVSCTSDPLYNNWKMEKYYNRYLQTMGSRKASVPQNQPKVGIRNENETPVSALPPRIPQAFKIKKGSLNLENYKRD